MYKDNNMLYLKEYSCDVTFSFNEMGILSINLNNINLSNTSSDEDDPETIIHVKDGTDFYWEILLMHH